MSKIDYDLSLIRAFVFDVDGVLSPQTVPIDGMGEPNRLTNIRDGYAIHRAVKDGFKMAIISGGKTENVEMRYRKLGIEDIFMSARVKLPVLQEWMARNSLMPEEVVFVGDDIPDLMCMRYVGLPCAPYDAAREVLTTARYVSKMSGGYGVARDIIEEVLRAQDKWPVVSVTGGD